MWMAGGLIHNTNAKDCMMFLLETEFHKVILNTWNEVETHPLFAIARVCERTPIGWMAI